MNEAVMTGRERAVRGAQFLDQVSPGWERHVKLRELRMEDPCHCVLAHVYGSFSHGGKMLRLAPVAMRSFGFNVDERDDPEFIWKDLDAAWEEQISIRLLLKEEAALEHEAVV